MAARHAKENFIRTAPLARSLRLAHAAAFACTLSAAPAALADEFDWLYFPMYTGDTAHAVHLSKLKFRADGLLVSATRYPRWKDDWTGPESDAGWYNYSERLIDCETGYFLDTAKALLDRDSATLASQPVARAAQIERLQQQLSESSQQWPDGGEIFMACAAASNKTFQKQRAAAAAKVQPLYSNRSLVDVLTADSLALREVPPMQFDFAAFARKPAAPAGALFDAMRSQAIGRRQNMNAAHAPVAADAAGDAQVQAAANRGLQEAGLEHLVIDKVSGEVIDFTYPKEDRMLRFLPRGSLKDEIMQTARVDCEYGFSLPVAQQTLKAGKRGPVVPLKVKAVLENAALRVAQESGLEDDAAAICKVVAVVRSGGKAPAKVPDLNALPTPEAMLMAIRAYRRTNP